MTLEQAILEKVRSPQEVDERGWPIGLFERVCGICADDLIVIDDRGISKEVDDENLR